MLLVVAEHLKHDGFALHVLDEGLGDLHRNLLRPRQKEKRKRARHAKITWLMRVCSVGVHPRSARGRSPEGLPCRRSSEARWKKPRRGDAGS